MRDADDVRPTLVAAEVERVVAALGAQSAGASVEAEAIAEAARVAERKVTALLHALARTGALSPRGEAFVVTSPARVVEASARLVKEAAALREADRARVRAMMQYGERLACRWAQVRAHFGETGDGGCARCDVCTSSGAGRRGDEGAALRR